MIRIIMDMAYNVRDIGGYCNYDGDITKSNVFLRGGGITGLTDNDIKKLIDYNVRTIIDLRGPTEIEKKPNTFEKHDIVKYYNIPLLDGIDESIDPPHNAEDYLGDLYVVTLDYGKKNFHKVFKVIANSMDNCTLFHCTAGKDRTGMIAALLLDLCGVPLMDIVANYEVTNTYIKDRLEEIIGIDDSTKTRLGMSKPISIERFMQHLYNNYGNAENYLKHIDISDEEISNIRNNFIIKTI